MVRTSQSARYSPADLNFLHHLRSGGNITGIGFFINVMEGKRLALLRELAPIAARIGVLVNPGNPSTRIKSEN